MAALESQHLSWTYLAHHELQSAFNIIVVIMNIITIIIIIDVMQKIDAEEAAIWEEMLSAADLVQEEARQRYKKSKESKEVHDSLNNTVPYTPKGHMHNNAAGPGVCKQFERCIFKACSGMCQCNCRHGIGLSLHMCS